MVPTDDGAETVREFATRFADGSFAEAAGLCTGDGRDAIVESFPDEFREGSMDAADALEEYWWGLHGQYGRPESVADVSATGDDAIVEFELEAGTETATIEIDGDGVEDFRFDPEYEGPDYVDESAFREHPTTVDVGDVALDGVLTVPDGNGPSPGVVLVHGAGIHDSDGTAGASKILKDLAWGLATEGIASLRYEKRLAEHEVADEDYTIDTVVTDDAVVAVDELAAADEVADDALFVTGHSQGGMVAPRIADRQGDVAGVVNLDGRAEPTLDPDDLAFMRYEFEIDGELDDEQAAQLEETRETARRIAEGDFEDDETLWGRPGTWHRSVADSDPLGTAEDLERPVFVAKTSRADEELQPELDAWLREQYETWQAADLPDGSRVEFYDGLDHYLQEGFAPTMPLSLYFGGNVDDDVVADVASWIHDVAPR